MKKIIAVIALILFLCGCSSKEELTAVEKLMKENEYIIVDVRTEREYNGNHIVGSINIPYDELKETDKLDKDKLIFVYCQSGSRSLIAYDILAELGYEVYDLGAFAEIDMPKVQMNG